MWSVLEKIRCFRYQQEDRRFVSSFYALAGFAPSRLGLYRLALIPPSAAKKHNGFGYSNRRLEFLGDALLSSIVAELIFMKYPYKHEGFLTDMRSSIVNRDSLNNLAYKIGVSEMLQYYAGGNVQPCQLGDVLEALIGAVYLDKGYTTCKQFVMIRLIQPYYDLQHMADSIFSYKSKIIEWTQQHNRAIRFEVNRLQDPSSDVQFVANVFVDDKLYGQGIGRTKKKATQQASQSAYMALQ